MKTTTKLTGTALALIVGGVLLAGNDTVTSALDTRTNHKGDRIDLLFEWSPEEGKTEIMYDIPGLQTVELEPPHDSPYRVHFYVRPDQKVSSRTWPKDATLHNRVSCTIKRNDVRVAYAYNPYGGSAQCHEA